MLGIVSIKDDNYKINIVNVMYSESVCFVGVEFYFFYEVVLKYNRFNLVNF